MKKNSIQTTIASAALGTALLLGTAIPAFAEDTVSVGASVKVDATQTMGLKERREGMTASSSAGVKADILAKRIAKAKERANEEIARRITSLTNLNTRIQAMARVSTTTKTTISASITTQINTLNTLKAKIAADTDLDTLKADIKTITESYRIYALVIPQAQIAVAADKILTVADAQTTVSGKLQSYISQAQTAGKDVTSLNTLLADMNAKIADAKVQANAGVTLTATLTPDMGDKTKMESNKQALSDGRAKIKLGEQDLKAAQSDARKIVQGLKAFSIKTDIEASSTKKMMGDKEGMKEGDR